MDETTREHRMSLQVHLTSAGEERERGERRVRCFRRIQLVHHAQAAPGLCEGSSVRSFTGRRCTREYRVNWRERAASAMCAPCEMREKERDLSQGERHFSKPVRDACLTLFTITIAAAASAAVKLSSVPCKSTRPGPKANHTLQAI